MITVIHGDDIASSRNYFIQQKEKAKDSFIFEGENVSLTALVQIFEGGGLFGEEQTLFVEELLSKKKAGKELDEITSYLNKQKISDIFLWESKEITKKQLQVFPKAIQKLFKFPQSIFTFLDNIRPDNQTQIVAYFHQTLSTSEAEFVLYMLVRQFRLLLAVKEKTGETIDEAVRLVPWQKSKLERQASLFTEKQLKIIYKRLFEIDLAQKTGMLSQPLSHAIDFFLLEI